MGWPPPAAGRTDRFAEEVFGFSVAGYADEPCELGCVALPDNTLAVLSQQNVLVLADPANNTVRTIPLNNGAQEVQCRGGSSTDLLAACQQSC